MGGSRGVPEKWITKARVLLRCGGLRLIRLVRSLNMSTQEFGSEEYVYLRVFVKALHGARSTLKFTMPEYAAKMTELIEMPRENNDQIYKFLIDSHEVVIDARNSVYKNDEEASNLLDCIHNIPYGLLGRFEEKWNWKESLPPLFSRHEKDFLSGLKKYSGLLPNGFYAD